MGKGKSADPFDPFDFDSEPASPVTQEERKPVIVTLAKFLKTIQPQTNLIFDIETGPESWERLVLFGKPFQPMPDFDPGTVKTGEFRDKDPNVRQAKIDEKIARLRTEHEEKQAGAEQAWKDEIVSGAALDATRGRVLCIGYGFRDLSGSEPVDVVAVDDSDDEAVLLKNFWTIRKQSTGMIGGHGVKNFDVPFLMRRSSLHDDAGLAPPLTAGKTELNRYTDSMEAWQCGVWNDRFTRLDALAAFYGTRPKSDDIGKDFHVYWNSDRKRALSYSVGDIVAELDVFYRMGLYF